MAVCRALGVIHMTAQATLHEASMLYLLRLMPPLHPLDGCQVLLTYLKNQIYHAHYASMEYDIIMCLSVRSQCSADAAKHRIR